MCILSDEEITLIMTGAGKCVCSECDKGNALFLLIDLFIVFIDLFIGSSAK